MTYSINASGTKAECLETLEGLTPDDFGGDAASSRQCERVRDFAIAEINRFEEGSDKITISISGHVPGDGGGSRSLSINISGNAAVRVVPDPVKADGSKLPPVTGTFTAPQGPGTVRTR